MSSEENQMATLKLIENLKLTFQNPKLEHLVFVYGTLKTNQPNNSVMFNTENGLAKFVCKAKTIDKWPLVIGSPYNIPYLLDKTNTGHQIQGEIYAVDGQMLKFLDEFEGHPTYYQRRETDVYTDDHGQLKPWIYFLNRYKANMLTLTMHANYDSFGEHGLRYVERLERYGPDAKVHVQ